MSDMPDGNTAALRQHEAAQDQAQARFDAYGERAIQSIIEDVLDGDALKNVRAFAPKDQIAADFMEDVAAWIDSEELANLITASSEARERITNRLRKKLAEKVREWCEESSAGQDLVDQRVRDLDEDARDRHKEREDD